MTDHRWRRWLRRHDRAALATTALVLAGVLLAALAPPARAGRYVVAQCDRANRAYTDARFERVNPGDYAFGFRCEEDESASSLQIHPITGAPAGRFGRISWAAPPSAKIVGVSGEARLRNDSGQQARLSFLDPNGNEVGRIATGSDSPGGFEPFSRQLTDGGRDRFGAGLNCVAADGCPYTDQARAWIRSVRLTINDPAPPGVGLSGALTATGWHRGTEVLSVFAGDFGSGIRRIDVSVNGNGGVPPAQGFECSVIPGSQVATRTQPCAASRTVSAALDTRRAPFVDGVNRLLACAHDYGEGGQQGCAVAEVRVDNAPPEVAFASARDPEQPELIRAPVADRHSGLAGGGIAYRPLDGGAWRELPTTVAGGELRATVDSTSEPPGRYLFRAGASDVLGNATATTRRADGDEMVLTFPLREPTRIEASIEGDDRATVDYGRTPSIEGTLSGIASGPLSTQAIDVVETFAAGSSLEPVGRTVTTDLRGRFSVPLSRGPSRSVSLRYAGTRRYQASGSAAMELKVRGSATLVTVRKRVRAGGRARFEGAVGNFGAELADGKLVELQVKGGGIRRFRTIRQAFRTAPDGSWRLQHRFDRFYRRPTRFLFRLKVSREAGWPYVSPSVSRTRRLTVVPLRRGRR